MIIDNQKKILSNYFKTKNFSPFERNICDFVIELSKLLMRKFNPKEYPDIYTFAFFCRQANVKKIREEFFKSNKIKKSIGLVFHVPPNNISTNFAYSFIFSLLLGNSNIVRVSNRLLNLSGKIIYEIDNLMKRKYQKIYKNNFFVFYEKSELINKYLSMKCDSRMIWGGNDTVNHFKNIQTLPHVRDIFFYDRYSICLINSDYISKISKKSLEIIIKKFYNDTYLVDQAACSSPILINWIGKNIEKAKKKFWGELYKYLKKINYQNKFSEFISIDKDVVASVNFALNKKYIHKYFNYSNLINIVELNKVPKNFNLYKGKFGFFFQFNLKKLSDLDKFVKRDCQTMTQIGMDKNQIKNFLIKKNSSGIDRVVEVGNSLDMVLVWDGIDLKQALTREIKIS